MSTISLGGQWRGMKQRCIVAVHRRLLLFHGLEATDALALVVQLLRRSRRCHGHRLRVRAGGRAARRFVRSWS